MSSIQRRDPQNTLEALSRQITDRLLLLLHSASDVDRARAARVLSSLKTNDTLNVLADLLRNSLSEALRSVAASALGKSGDPRAVQPLVDALRDKDHEVVMSAIGALAELDVATSLEPLIRVLTSYEVEAVGMPPEDYVSANTIGAMWRETESITRMVRFKAAQALRTISNAPVLFDTLRADSHDDKTRLAVIIATGQSRSSQDLKLLAHVLVSDDFSPGEREVTVSALGASDKLKVVDSLVQAIDSQRNPYMKVRIANALGNLGDTQATQPLIRTLLSDTDKEARKEARKEVRREVRKEVRKEVLGAVGLALAKLGDMAAVEPLLHALAHHPDRYVRRIAALILGQLGDKQAVEPLARALIQDRDADVRAGAAWALGHLGDWRAAEPLIHALAHARFFYWRRDAAYALGVWSDPLAVEPLIDALTHDQAWEVRRRAAWALGKMGDRRAVEPLIDALTGDSHWRVRAMAAEVLMTLGDSRAAESLLQYYFNVRYSTLPDALSIARRLGKRFSELSLSKAIYKTIMDRWQADGTDIDTYDLLAQLAPDACAQSPKLWATARKRLMLPTLYTFAQGLKDGNEGQRQTARQLFNRIVEQFPDFTRARERLEAHE